MAEGMGRPVGGSRQTPNGAGVDPGGGSGSTGSLGEVSELEADLEAGLLGGGPVDLPPESTDVLEERQRRPQPFALERSESGLRAPTVRPLKSAATQSLADTLRAEAQALAGHERDTALGQHLLSISAQVLVAETGAALATGAPIDRKLAQKTSQKLLAQLDVEIAAAEARLPALQEAAAWSDEAVAGNPERAKLRAEAWLALGATFPVTLGGSTQEVGPLPERLAALRESRAALALLGASLEATLRPDLPTATLLRPVRAERERLTGMLRQAEALLARMDGEGVPANAAMRAVAEGQVRGLHDSLATLDAVQGGIEQRWQGAYARLARLSSVVGLPALAEARTPDSPALITALATLENRLGITPPTPARGADPARVLEERLVQVEVAFKQGGALIGAWLREDGGLNAAQLVELGLVERAPQSLDRAALQRIGLGKAIPGRLNAAQEQQALVALVNTDPAVLERAMTRLHGTLYLDGRQAGADLVELIRIARSGTLPEGEAARGSFTSARLAQLGDRQILSSNELGALERAVAGRPPRALAALRDDPSLPSSVRHTAAKLAAHPGVSNHLQTGAGAAVDPQRLTALRQRLARYDYPEPEAGKGESFDGKIGLASFYDPAQLDADVKALYDAMAGGGTDDARIFATLEGRSHAERQLLIVEFARYVAGRGHDPEDSGYDALFKWIEGDQEGWERGKSMHLLIRRRGAREWAQELHDVPSERGSAGSTIQAADGSTVELGSPAGRLAWQRGHLDIFKEPYGVADMGDKEGVRRWRTADTTARGHLATYEAAVRDGDPKKIAAAEQAFVNAAGEAIALHHVLTAGYSEQLQARIEFLEAVPGYVRTGAVITAATVAAVGVTAATAGAGAPVAAAILAGALAGTAAGTVVGFSSRVSEEMARGGSFDPSRLSREQWQRIGGGTVGDLKLAAGTAVAAAIPVAGFGRMAYLARAAAQGQNLGRVQAAVVAFQSLPKLVHMAGAGAAFNTAGAFGMRGVHASMNWTVDQARSAEGAPAWLKDSLREVDTRATADLELSWRNLLIEVGSGAVSGGLNRYLGFLDDAARAGTPAATAGTRSLAASLGARAMQAGRRSAGFSVDMSLNLADETARNLVYGRSWNEGLTDALLLGAPGNLAAGFAARRAAAQQSGGRRSDEADTPATTPTGDATLTPRGSDGEPGASLGITTSDGAPNAATAGRTAGRGAPELSDALRLHLGDAGNTWFAALSPPDARAAENVLSAFGGTPPAFDAAHLSKLIRLRRNGFAAADLAALPRAAAEHLATNLTDFQRNVFYSDPRNAAAAGNSVTSSPTQAAWNRLVELVGDPARVTNLAQALRPTLRPSDWRPVVTRLRQTEAGRRFLAEHQRARFAKSALLEMKQRWGSLPDDQQPPIADIIAWYQQRWERSKERFNNGLGGRHGIRLEGEAPGLAKAPRNVQTFEMNLTDEVLNVFSGVDDPFQSRLGYAGSSHRAAGSRNIHILNYQGGKRTIGDNTDAKIATLLHEMDHVQRGFAYRRAATVEDVAYNLLGESLAPFHEMAVFEPKQLRELLSDPAALYFWLVDKQQSYARPEVAGPDYFKLPAGKPDDAAVHMVIDRLTALGKQGPKADPVSNIVDAMTDPRGTGMLGGFYAGSNRTQIDAVFDTRRQEALRRLGVDFQTLEGLVRRQGWDRDTADRFLELARDPRVDFVTIRGFNAGEIELLWKALRSADTPSTKHRSFSGAQLSPEQLRVIATYPALMRRLNAESLRGLSAATLDALGKNPELLTRSRLLSEIKDLEPTEIGPWARRLALSERLSEAGLGSEVTAWAERGETLGALGLVLERSRAGTLRPDDPLLTLLARDAPTVVWEAPFGGLREWLTDLGVTVARPEGLSTSHLGDVEVPPGTSRNDAELALARRMLTSSGLPADAVARLEGPALIRLWAAAFSYPHSFGSAFATVGEARSVSGAATVADVEKVGRGILTAHRRNSLTAAGVDPALLAGLGESTLGALGSLVEAGRGTGLASRDFAQIEDVVREVAPADRAEALIDAVRLAHQRRALVLAGAPVAAVDALSPAQLETVAQAQRLQSLGADPRHRERALERLRGEPSGQAIADAVTRLLATPAMGSRFPSLSQMRQDLVALGASADAVARLSGPALVRLHQVRLTDWNAASAPLTIASDVRPASVAADPLDAIVAQLVAAEPMQGARQPSVDAATAAPTFDPDVITGATSPVDLHSRLTQAAPNGLAPELDVAPFVARWANEPAPVRMAYLNTLRRFARSDAQRQALR